LVETFENSTNFEILFHGLLDLDCLTTKLGTSVAPIDLKSPAHLLEKSAGSISFPSCSSVVAEAAANARQTQHLLDLRRRQISAANWNCYDVFYTVHVAVLPLIPDSWYNSYLWLDYCN
tara:strand:- start:318 stop:674 length:357 start_codon:yes stop_codon:yes gene_type:complete